MKIRNSFRYFTIPLFIPLLVVIFFSCSGNEKGGGGEGVRSINADGFVASEGLYSESVRSTGELISWEEVELRTPVAGNVLRIHFREGQAVNRGALLLEIDNRTWLAQKKGLEAQLESATSELSRRERLLEMEGASQETVDQAMVAVSDLKAQIEELDVRIDLSRIRAPFSGTLGLRDFSPGAYLMQGDIITRLVQANKLRVNFDIPSQYAGLARVDTEVKVLPSSGSDTLSARIYAIEPAIDATTRSLTIRAEIDNQTNTLIPGDFVQVFFEVQMSRQAILIPAEALIAELNRQVVYMVKNGVAARTEVEAGSRTHNMVHITEGISPGDTIMITGLMEVRDGIPVKITKLSQEAVP